MNVNLNANQKVREPTPSVDVNKEKLYDELKVLRIFCPVKCLEKSLRFLQDMRKE